VVEEAGKGDPLRGVQFRVDTLLSEQRSQSV